jgi:hypothetical protein
MFDYNKRINEVKNFIKIIENNNLECEYINILLLKELPFKDTDNIYEEMKEISNILKIQINSYYELLMCMISCSFKNNAYDSWIASWLASWLNKYNLSERSFFLDQPGSWLIGKKSNNKLEPFEKIEKYLKENFNNEILEYEKQLIGDFGEYKVMEFLKQKDFIDTDWVSKTIGDGLGYDIVTTNKETNRRDYVEVKTSIRGNLSTLLSKNETSKLDTINSNKFDEHFHIVFVPLYLSQDNNITNDIIDLAYVKDSNRDYEIFPNPNNNAPYIKFIPLNEEKDKCKVEIMKWYR